MSTPFSPVTLWGETGLFLLGNPAPRLTRRRLDVDTLEESWQAPSEESLKPGDPHPVRPGMIIDQVVSTPEIPDRAYVLDVTSLGSHDGATAMKVLQRSKRRSFEGWDERALRVLSWHAEWKPCKGVAATNTIHCDGHAFPDAQRVYFARKTGGSGITAQSSSSLGVGYFVCNRGTNQFQVSLTPGGAVHALGTDITSCEVIAAEFALGAPHPEVAGLYLCELQTQDENTDWKTSECVYRGLEEDRPYHRLVTISGQQTSSSSPITIDLVGGWGDPRYSSFHLPEVVVTDTYLSTSTLPTSAVPSFSTPPNAPAIATFVIEGDNLQWNYPYGWTLIACPQQATLNSQINVHVFSAVYRYIWPVSLR